MQDLSSISKALREVVDSPAPDEEKLTSTIERFLVSNDPAVRVAAVKTLAGILDEIKESELSDEDKDAKLRLIFEETALAFIPALLPILPDSAAEVGSLVLQSAETGRPREVIMALNEALQYILDRTEAAYLSDEEEESEEPNYEILGRELSLIIRSYEQAVRRLKNKKSTSTIMALSDAFAPVFSSLYQHLDERAARNILHCFCRLICAAWDWAQTTEDAKGEPKMILTNLHLSAVTLFGPRVGARLLESWFLTTFPRYDYTGEEAQKPKHDLMRGRISRVPGLLELHLAVGTARNLGVDPDDMNDRLIHPSSTNPHSALAALILTAAQLPLEHSEQYSPTPTLSDCMPVLSAALSSVAIDAGCAYLWALVHAGAAVTSDEATLLIELLMPLIAFPSNDITRTALTKLLEAIIATQTTEAKRQIFKELLEPINPFESIRLATFPILRQNLISDQSLLTSTTFDTLSPIIFTLPQDEQVLEMSLEEVVSTMYPSWFTECANLLWFMYDLDTENRTGIRDQATLLKIHTEWLDPITIRVGQWKREAEGGEGEARVGFVIQRLTDALERAHQTIRR